MYNSTCCNNSEDYVNFQNYNTEQECNSVMIPFTATIMMPSAFDYNCPTQISMSLSTENLSIYKELVEYTVKLRDYERDTGENYKDINDMVSYPRRDYSIKIQEKDLTRNQMCNKYNPCKPIIKKCKNYIVTKIGEVRICGTLIYRIAINGTQSDSLIIDPSIQDIVNIDGNIWSSGDGYIGISDGRNNYITIGYIPCDEDVDMTSLKVCLKSLKLASVCKDRCSSDLRLTLKGKVLITYTLPT